MTLRTLNYGNYGIFLIMGHAGFCPSAVGLSFCFKDFRGSGDKGRNCNLGLWVFKELGGSKYLLREFGGFST